MDDGRSKASAVLNLRFSILRHFGGAHSLDFAELSPSFLRKSVNSPSGGRWSFSRVSFARKASSVLPEFR